MELVIFGFMVFVMVLSHLRQRPGGGGFYFDWDSNDGDGGADGGSDGGGCGGGGCGGGGD